MSSCIGVAPFQGSSTTLTGANDKITMQGTTSLIGASDPVWILGVCYEGCSSPKGEGPPTLKQEV